MLGEFEANQDQLRSVYRLDRCQTCPGGDACDPLFPPPLNFSGWPSCPVSLLRSPAWQYVIRLHNAAQVSPLAQWPNGYPAWVVYGLQGLASAIATREAERARR